MIGYEKGKVSGRFLICTEDDAHNEYETDHHIHFHGLFFSESVGG
jgi:hypothetical protein